MITRHCARTFVRLQIAQRRNFFERGVNTVRWARLRHRHVAVSVWRVVRLARTRCGARGEGRGGVAGTRARARTSRTELRGRLTNGRSGGRQATIEHRTAKRAAAEVRQRRTSLRAGAADQNKSPTFL